MKSESRPKGLFGLRPLQISPCHAIFGNFSVHQEHFALPSVHSHSVRMNFKRTHADSWNDGCDRYALQRYQSP